MIRVAITDQGKFLFPKDLTTPAQLRAAVEQARGLIIECEKLLQPKAADGGTAKSGSAPKPGGTPYLT